MSLTLTPRLRSVQAANKVNSGNIAAAITLWHDINDDLIAAIAIPTSDSISSVTGATGWSKLGHVASSAGTRLEIWTKKATTNAEATPTFVRSSSSLPAQARISCVRGSKNSSPYLVSLMQGSTSAAVTATTPFADPSLDNCLLMGFVSADTASGGTASFTAPANGFTEIADDCTSAGAAVNQAVGVFTKTQTARTVENTSLTISSSRNWAAAMVAIAPQLPAAGATWYSQLYVEETNPKFSQKHVGDLYLPTAAFTGANPCCIQFHGGSTGGDKSSPPKAVMELLLYGVAVFSINWRLIDATNTWKTSCYDTKAAIRWLRANARSFGLDPNKIGGWGNSAGSTGQAVMMLTPGHPNFHDLSLGNPEEREDIPVNTLWFGESHAAFVDSELAALAITRGQTPACTIGSAESESLGNTTTPADVCALPRFDGAIPDPSLNLYNEFSGQYWTSRHTCGANWPKINIAAGTVDNIIPYLQSWNDQSGAGAGLPTGLFQKLVAAGFPSVRWNLNSGGGHGGTHWLPPSDGTSTNPSFVNDQVRWMVANLFALGVYTPLPSPRVMRGGMLLLNDRDLVDFNLVVREAPGLPVARDLEWASAQPVGSSSSLTLSKDPRTGVRVIDVNVSCLQDSQSALIAALERLEHWCSLGPLELRSKHDLDTVYLVRWKSAQIGIPTRQFKRTMAAGVIRFECLTPYPFRRYAESHATSGSGSGGRVLVPCGSVPFAPDFLITGATNPTVTQRSADGTVVQVASYAVTQATSDALLVDNALGRITKYTGGVESEDPTILNLGYGYFAVRPEWQQLEAGAFQTFEISTGALTVLGRRGFLR